MARPLIFLSLFSCIIFWQRFHTRTEPLECDTAFYSVLANEWRQGRSFYADLWDSKPPGVIVTYAAAQKVAGNGPRSILFLGTLASLLTLLGIYYAVYWLTKDSSAGLWAAAFWTLANASLVLEANQPASDVFVNVFWVMGIAFLCKALRNEKKGSAALWVAGSALAAASFYKHNVAISNGLIILTYAAIQFIQRKSGPTILKALVPLLAPSIVFWAAVFGYFALTNRFATVWTVLVTFSRHYASGSPPIFITLGPAALKAGIIRGVFDVLGPLTAGSLLAYHFAWQAKEVRWLLLIGYLLAAWIALALPGRFYSHYYQLLLPPLAMACGGMLRLAKRKSFYSFILSTIALTLFIEEASYYRLAGQEWSRIKYGEVYLSIQKMGNEIGRNLLPEETFFEAGYEPGLYYYSRKRPPTGIIMADLWETGPLQKPLMDQLQKDLEQNKPELFITTRFWLSANNHAELPVIQWCLERYQPFPKKFNYGPFLLFARKGGSLAQRIAPRQD